MARIFLMALILWLQLLIPAFAGVISDIRVGKKAQNEIEIIIKGEYSSYRAFTLQSPFRFIIDLEGARLKKGLPRSIDIKGSIISRIRAGQGGNRSRIVLDSADKALLFHSNIQEKDRGLIVKCWRQATAETMPSHSAGSYTSFPGARPVVPQKALDDLLGRPEKAETLQGDDTKKLARYSGDKITLDFYKTDIHNVFRLFAEISGKNIIVDERVKGELTLALTGVPWDLALDIILEQKNLRKTEKLNTYIILPMPGKATGKGELVVHKVSDEVLQPAKLRKLKKENRQKAQNLILEGHNLETQGNKEEALKIYEKAYNYWKNNIDLIKKTAYLHYISGNFARSYFYAKEALKINRKDSEAALYAALPAVRMGKKHEAKILFKAAISGSPKIPEAYYNYGLFLERQKDYDNSLYVYEKYETLFGPSLQLSLAIARLYEAQERNKDACNKYTELQFSGFSIDEDTERLIQTKIKTLCD